MLDQKRVAEIWVPSTSERGSGYVLCHGCVLTAYHVVKGSAKGQKDIDFRLLKNGSDWLKAEILWKNEALDLALLQFTGNLSFAVPPPKVAPLDFNQSIACNACGFPSFEVVKDYKKTVCQEYRAEGWIKPTDLTATKNPGRLLMEIEGAIPNDMTDWKGISGSAVFSTQGGLLGVILDGPENLQGQQIHLISLGWVLQNHPDFNETLKNTFQQCLEFYNPIAVAAFDRYKLEIQIRQIEAQEVCTKAELADYQARKKRFSRDLYTFSIDRHQLEACLAAVPEKELEQILEALDTRYPQNIREVWHHTAPSRLAKVSDIQSIHALLLGTKDSTLLSRFLSTLVHQLEKIDRPEIPLHITTLTEIALKLGQRLERDLIPQALQTQPQTATKEMGTTLILIKLKQLSTANQSAEYSIGFYKISDSKAYQAKVKQNSDLQADPLTLTPDQLQALNLEVSNTQTLTFRLADSGDLENALKEKLAEVLQTIFEVYPNLREVNPHLLFYVSKSLLAVDFQNLDFDLIDTLGFQFPIVVSCLDRYEQPESPLHRFWRKRWDALETPPLQPLHHYLKSHAVEQGGKPLQLSNAKALNKQLLQLDSQGATVVGLNFDGSDQNFLETFDTLFATGLGIFLCPQQPLTRTETDYLNQALQVCPDRFLTVLRETYRVNAEVEAGSLSVLIDNPYLPLPDIEYA